MPNRSILLFPLAILILLATLGSCHVLPA